MRNKSVNVVKVPLDSYEVTNRSQNFPSMPILYLELIENKKKVKKELVNKDYRPEDDVEDFSNDPSRSNDFSSKLPDKGGTDFDRRLDELLESSENPKPVLERSEENNNFETEEIKSTSPTVSINEDVGKSSPASSVDELSNRLKELLNDDSGSEGKSKNRSSSSSTNRFHQSPSPSYDKYSVKRNEYGRPTKDYQAQAPTLAELESKGVYNKKKEMKDVDDYDNDENYEDEKRELLFKFDLLKKSYPNSSYTIPEFTVHSDYKSMVKAYDVTIRRLSLDNSVEQYKTYLIGGFMGCEFVLGHFFNLDMQGFTQQQLMNMQSYEKMLIEIGEKSYMPEGSRWPVEVRLLVLVITNAAFFLVSKMIMKKTGSNLMNMINNMNVATKPTTGFKKRKMKGPSINLDEIPDN